MNSPWRMDHCKQRFSIVSYSMDEENNLTNFEAK